jgi:hypothetical protein
MLFVVETFLRTNVPRQAALATATSCTLFAAYQPAAAYQCWWTALNAVWENDEARETAESLAYEAIVTHPATEGRVLRTVD